MAERQDSSLSERRYGPQIVLFCGGRDCTDASHGGHIHTAVFGLTRGSIVLHGGAKGADTLADTYARRLAKDRDLHVCRMDALWDAYGRSAGPRRNRAMMIVRPDFAFCYPTGGPGTQGMIELLAEAGVPHVIQELPVPKPGPQIVAYQPCNRVLVGRGTDTWDPMCALPDGHDGRCLTEREAVARG
jgi:hypothetical protein